MKKQSYLIGTTLIAAAALSLILAQNAWSQVAPEANKLEGAWIAKIPGTALQWSYVMVPDSSGHRASITTTLHVRIPGEIWFAQQGVPPVDYFTPFVGELVMTGPDTAKFTGVGYGMKKVTPSATYPFFEQVVYICVASGDLKFTGPGKMESTYHIANYLPTADMDGDGLPDAGQTPLVCLPPTTTMDTRVGLVPPCNP